MQSLFSSLSEKVRSRKKMLAQLIDPDKTPLQKLSQTADAAEKAGVDYFFAGGSLLTGDGLPGCVTFLKENSAIPVLLFPGSRFQIVPQADALLLLSLISGRNPDLLIGQHVLAAPELRRSGLEIIPTGYMLIDGGTLTSVNYITQTLPIPYNKPDIAVATAQAGEMLGMKLIYLEAGSGAKRSVSPEMIAAVRQNIHVPLVTGGGIRTAENAYECCVAGADVIVVGNGFEESPGLVAEVAAAVREAGTKTGKTAIA